MANGTLHLGNDWGHLGIGEFTATTHENVYEQILPSHTKLPQPYVVCIIGASRGIGASVAYAFAQAGASGIVLCSRDISGLKSVAKQCEELNPECKTSVVACDITSSDSVGSVAKHVQTTHGRLDAAIVNSGWSGPLTPSITEGDPSILATVTDTNFIGTYRAAHYLLPLLCETSPSGRTPKAFFTVGSNAAFLVRGPIANTHYCISKMAQLRLVEHIHEQYKDRGILTANFHPGTVLTELSKSAAPKDLLPRLRDSPDLCGAYMVWLLRPREAEDMSWLGGRHLSVKWDVHELMQRKEEIIKKDLLKVRLAIGL